MLNDIYISVQAELNKDRLGYLKPMHFNSFVNRAIRKLFNNSFKEHKTNVRKKNWMLDGKNFANLSEFNKQLLEYYSDIKPIQYPYNVPDDLEYILDVYNANDIECEKVDYSDLLNSSRNIYCKPSDCAPMCSLVGTTLKIKPDQQGGVTLHYVRKPKKAKWTFIEYQGIAMFDETANDYQDCDMPETFFSDIISLVVEYASIMLRELNVTQLENQEQASEIQIENQQ